MQKLLSYVILFGIVMLLFNYGGALLNIPLQYFDLLIVVGLIYAFRHKIAALWRPGNKAPKVQQTPRPAGFALHLGKSTGKLRERNHAAGAPGGLDVWLALPDAATNICVMGGIGSGKTTRVVQPALDQLLAQDCGGLVFDIKGDFKKAVGFLATAHNKRITTIGVGHPGFNLLEGLSPEMAASFMKSAFYIAGGGDPFWIDSATNLCRNAFGILSHIPGKYTMEGLYLFLFSESDRQEILDEAAEKLAALEDERQRRILQRYLDNYTSVFANLPEKIKESVKITVAQLLENFTHPDYADAFSVEPEGRPRLESVLDGEIFVLDLPLAIWGESAKVVYTFVKLRFMNIMQQRQARPELDQKRPVFFMCDEYQNAVSASSDGLSDLSFWDKSRSAKCVGIISMQSYNSFVAAIKAPNAQALADTILQNFRQKVFFRTEDVGTLKYLDSLAGKSEVIRVTENQNASTTSGINSSESQGQGISRVWTERAAVDSQLIRGLGQNQAIAFLNIDGQAVDDVIEMQPLFID